ncbi:hypothetical protein ACU5P1_17215 [Pseudomonas plecoglossicida]|uniref:Uncharacterized protein n=1 Tax=Pseudomonas plecoglossicida TaxID=70775 RepID=A0AAD0VT09_PSEDL|nr:hypothetical protein [Pseudomonas plecoglossicida]AXM95652.1 hypothetical protein DVB73_07505 [Pseudomonas plecoglossicida]EPB94469.1 hypothetical protein L321_19037 [Pseudomonas plecoglossicida NB2011]QLB56402.1 hypothetical protein HAV28_17045 [Pseudomonas plecoglossicida]
MNRHLFDLDLTRVSRDHYITGKAAINFPIPGVTTGGWHFTSYWDRVSGVCKVSLAGIHFPDTSTFFGEAGVLDATQVLAERGWHADGKTVWMANHCRAAADMIVRWALSDSQHCSVEISDWFPSSEDRQHFLDLMDSAKNRLSEVGKLERVERWLDGQS